MEWEYNNESIELSQATERKYLLYATDQNLSHRDVVREYMENDFIEKTFRDLKYEEDMVSVRHRPEPGVRTYFFMIFQSLTGFEPDCDMISHKPRKMNGSMRWMSCFIYCAGLSL